MSSSKTDLMYEIEYNPDFSPIHASRVSVKTMIVDGRPTYIMKNHTAGSYYDLDELSNDIWSLIDGRRTITEITEQILSKWKGKDESVDANTVKEVVSFFAESNCLKATYETVKKKKLRIVSAFEIDVALLGNSLSGLRRIHRAVRPLFKSPLLWIVLGFVSINSILFAGRFAAIFANSRNFEILGSTVVGFFFYTFVVLGPAIIIHELAHAITLVHYGGTPGEIGTGLFYFGPMFYVDATDSWMLPRRQRVMVMMAGNISTLLIASIIVTWGFLWPFPGSVSQILHMAAFFCFYSTLMNLAPPFETDGYYVLSDLVNVPDLREKSYTYLKTAVKKALRLPVEEVQGLDRRKKRILLGYAILSGAWIVYTAYQTFIFTLYMAQDTAASLVEVSSAVLFVQSLPLVAIVISVASILYFAMTVTGYGIILVTAVQKAVRRTLKFESIHDRDLSVFFYLPSQIPKLVASDFRRQVGKIAEKLSPNYQIRGAGCLHFVVIRMGGTKLAMAQIREHLRKIESTFYSMYQKFLEKHADEILRSVGIYNPNKGNLTTLLKDMSDEMALSGAPEARNAVAQVLERENQATLYLLNSAFGSVWTIELPPVQRQEFLTTVLPTFFAEDLTVTDLYDDVEDFKKSTIYGFDSLAKLNSQSHKYLEKAVLHPEKHQVIFILEPVKSRLLFVGRTEEIEEEIAALGPLFVCQVWSGYLDRLLSETNLNMAALGNVPPIEKDEIQTLSDAELLTLHRNLSAFASYERLVKVSLEKAEKCVLQVSRSIEGVRGTLSSKKALPADSIDPVLAVNVEEMKRLPKRFETLREKLQRLYPQIKNAAQMTKTEFDLRNPHIAAKARKMLLVYPLIAVVSALLMIVGIWGSVGLTRIALIGVSVLLNLSYWSIYYLQWKSCHRIRKYPSSPFNRIQMYVLACTQALHKFLATWDVLIPSDVQPQKTEAHE